MSPRRFPEVPGGPWSLGEHRKDRVFDKKRDFSEKDIEKTTKIFNKTRLLNEPVILNL